MRTRWITFDCFGTLVDWHAGFSALLRPIAGDQTEALVRAYHRFEPRVQAQRPFQPYRQVLTTSLLRAAEEAGFALKASQAATLPEQWGSLPIFADVEESFTTLRTASFKIAVLTNCDEDLFRQTERSFRQPFDLVVTAERVRDYKPGLSHFRFFEQETRVDRADWVHVACSWYHDIAPARELGLKHIWLDRERTGQDATAASLRVFSATDLHWAVRRLHGNA